jgi:hypothetical protein
VAVQLWIVDFKLVKVLEEKRRLRTRAVFLAVVWIILLVLSLFFLSILTSQFASNPQGESISSLSWAGYIVSRTTDAKAEVTSISASWVVPAVKASEDPSFSSTWIGIGGQLEKTLIQVGTEQDATTGQGTYYAWYELLPSYAVELNITVSPGDVMVASISLVDSATNHWSIQISDTTTGQDFSTTVVYNSTRSSGEWIMERPTVANKLTTLADFGNLTFTGCYLDANNISGAISKFYFSRIEMTSSGNVQITSVSPLTANGKSFVITYTQV